MEFCPHFSQFVRTVHKLLFIWHWHCISCKILPHFDLRTISVAQKLLCLHETPNCFTVQCYISWLINNHCVPSLHCPRPGLLLFISRLMWMCSNSGWSRAGAPPTWLQTKLCSCLALLWILDIYHLVDSWCKQWPPQLPRNIRPMVQLGHRLQSALCIAQSVSPVHSGCKGQCTSFPLQCFIAHFTSGPEVYEYGLQVRCEVEGGHSWLSGDIIDNCGHFVDICHATRWHVTRRRCPHRIYTTYSP